MDPFTTSALISAGGGIVNSLVGKLFGDNGPDQRELMKWQEDMMQKQFDFQSSEAEKNRQFQSDESAVARDWNSINSQLQRARQAGINPYYLASQGSYGSAGGAVAPQGSQAGGAVVPQPAQNTFLQRSQAFSALASSFTAVTQGLSNLANAKKTGVDTQFVEKSMNDLLAKIKSDSNFAQLRNEFQTTVNKWSDKKQKAEVEKIVAEISSLDASASLSREQVNQVRATCKKLLAEANFTDTQNKQLNQFLDKYFDAYQQSVIDLNKANQNAANAGAYKSYQEGNLAIHKSAEADAQTDLLKSQKSLTDVNKKLADLSYNVKHASNGQERIYAVNNFANLSRQAGLMTDLMKEQLEKAMRDNDWGTVEKITSTILSLSESFKNVGVGVAGFKK